MKAASLEKLLMAPTVQGQSESAAGTFEVEGGEFGDGYVYLGLRKQRRVSIAMTRRLFFFGRLKLFLWGTLRRSRCC